MDLNLVQFSSNINHAPKVFYKYDEDEEGNEIYDGDFTMMFELSVPAPFAEIRKKGNKESLIKCMSPL